MSWEAREKVELVRVGGRAQKTVSDAFRGSRLGLLHLLFVPRPNEWIWGHVRYVLSTVLRLSQQIGRVESAPLLRPGEKTPVTLACEST